MLPADLLFWDGTRLIAIELSVRETERQQALIACGATVHRIEPSTLAGRVTGLDHILPIGFRAFWSAQALPSSPFRRPVPAPPPLRTVVGAGASPHSVSSSTYSPPAKRSTV
jgi:hypothetical protein